MVTLPLTVPRSEEFKSFANDQTTEKTEAEPLSSQSEKGTFQVFLKRGVSGLHFTWGCVDCSTDSMSTRQGGKNRRSIQREGQKKERQKKK
jgi:hypothetical protein